MPFLLKASQFVLLINDYAFLKLKYKRKVEIREKYKNNGLIINTRFFSLVYHLLIPIHQRIFYLYLHALYRETRRKVYIFGVPNLKNIELIWFLFFSLEMQKQYTF